MAIQNFLSGGYYGKLGATVGQRWKNKRTVRIWVKPANPRTPIQQANRNSFAIATKLSQIGNAVNFHCGYFINSERTEWNMRMSAARQNLKDFTNGVACVPLTPLGITPPNGILLQSIDVDSTEKKATVTVETTSQMTGKKFMLVYQSSLAGVSPDEIFICAGEPLSGVNTTITFNLADDEPLLTMERIYCRVCSYNDVESSTDMFISNIVEIPVEGGGGGLTEEELQFCSLLSAHLAGSSWWAEDATTRITQVEEAFQHNKELYPTDILAHIPSAPVGQSVPNVYTLDSLIPQYKSANTLLIEGYNDATLGTGNSGNVFIMVAPSSVSSLSQIKMYDVAMTYSDTDILIDNASALIAEFTDGQSYNVSIATATRNATATKNFASGFVELSAFVYVAPPQEWKDWSLENAWYYTPRSLWGDSDSETSSIMLEEIWRLLKVNIGSACKSAPTKPAGFKQGQKIVPTKLLIDSNDTSYLAVEFTYSGTFSLPIGIYFTMWEDILGESLADIGYQGLELQSFTQNKLVFNSETGTDGFQGYSEVGIKFFSADDDVDATNYVYTDYAVVPIVDIA